jgi:hypothetical protein
VIWTRLARSAPSRSAWDTFDSAGFDTSGTTGVHANSAAPHPGAAIATGAVLAFLNRQTPYQIRPRTSKRRR